MEKRNIYIFFDDIMRDYKNCYHERGEEEAAKAMDELFKLRSKHFNIMVITYQDVFKVEEWLLKNNLLEFVDNISNPLRRFALLNIPGFEME